MINKSEISRQNATKHGLSYSKEYGIWHAMMNRCYLNTDKAFKNYGARGICVDRRWHCVENFYSDMGPKPNGLSLDRVDNDGPYSKENCRWTDKKTQCNNMRKNKFYVIFGERLTMSQASDKFGIRYETLVGYTKSSKKSLDDKIKFYLKKHRGVII